MNTTLVGTLAPFVLASLVGPAAAAQAPQPAPVFGVAVEAVHIDVFASSDGKPLTGLTADDFEVRDQGVPQSVELLAHEQAPLHALLLLDTSASVARGKLEALKQAGRAFLGGLHEGDRVSLLTFNHRVSLRGAGVDRAAAMALLDATRAEGGTALYDALYAALGHADPRLGRPVVVVFSDGDDRLSWLTADQVLGVARESDATIYAVDTNVAATARPDLPRHVEVRDDVTGDTNRSAFLRGERSQDVRSGPMRPENAPPSFLQLAAAETGGRVLPAGAGDLQAAFLSVLGEVSSRYVLRYEPAGGWRPGWHELSVRLRSRKGELRTRRGYYVAEPQAAAAP